MSVEGKKKSSRKSSLSLRLELENKKRQEIFGQNDGNFIPAIWSTVDENQRISQQSLERANFSAAYGAIKSNEAILRSMVDFIHRMYEVTTDATKETLERVKQEHGMLSPDLIVEASVASSRRMNNLSELEGRARKYLEHIEDLENKLNLKSAEDLKRLSGLVYISSERVHDVLTIADASVDQVYRIYQSTSKDKYSSEVSEFTRKIISAMSRYLASLKASEDFDFVVSRDGKKHGIHGVFDRDYLGKRDMTIALNEPITLAVTALGLGAKDAENLKEQITLALKKAGISETQIDHIIKSLGWATPLSYYALDGLDGVLLDVEKLDVVVNERWQTIYETLKKSRCKSIVQYHVNDHVLNSATFEIWDVIIRLVSEKLGSPTSQVEQVHRARKAYINSYVPVLTKVAKANGDLIGVLNAIKSRKGVQYHELSDHYVELRDEILRLEKAEPRLIKSSDLRPIIHGLKAQVDNYREGRRFNVDPDSYTSQLTDLLDVALRKIELMGQKVKEHESRGLAYMI